MSRVKGSSLHRFDGGFDQKARLQVGEVPAVGGVRKGPGKGHGVNGETHDSPRTLHLVQSTRDALAHLQLWTREERERCGLR